MSTRYTGTTRWLVTITVVLVAILEVLDMTIVSVSLPNMMGVLGADSEQITWVLTSYIVSSAICMPLTGFLVNRFGQKKLLLLSIIGFMMTSMMCGFSNSMMEIIFFRTLQGVFGAALVPLSQVFLREAFTREEQGKAMAIWGMGIMVAPVLGPTVGGYITEALNWRWVFFVNIPICLVALLLAWEFLLDTPTKKINIDWLGLALMAIGIGCLQIFLDRGNQKNWFDSNLIIMLFITWVSALTYFIVRGLKIKRANIIDLSVFRNLNFSLGNAIMTLYCIALFGTLSLQPILLQNYMNYSASVTGLIMAPRGLFSAMAMALVAQTIKRFDPRWIVVLGMVLSAYGSFLMSEFPLDASISFMAWSGAVQGFGMGLFFVPLSVLTFSTLPSTTNAEAAGLFSFSRNLGSSIGISIFGTLMARLLQINWNQLGAQINYFNANLQHWLRQENWTLQTPAAVQTLATQLIGQTAIITFDDIFLLTGILFILLIPFVFFIKKPAHLIQLSEVGH